MQKFLKIVIHETISVVILECDVLKFIRSTIVPFFRFMPFSRKVATSFFSSGWLKRRHGIEIAWRHDAPPKVAEVPFQLTNLWIYVCVFFTNTKSKFMSIVLHNFLSNFCNKLSLKAGTFKKFTR